MEDLEIQTSTLKGFYNMDPFPSDANLRVMQGDLGRLQKFAGDSRPLFSPIQSIHYTGVQSFKTALDNTVSQLNAAARKANVLTPPAYYYSFQGQYNRLNFSLQSMRTMAHQMAEIQQFCSILFEAKINRLESIQRARAEDDLASTASDADYVPEPMRTTPLGTVYPYRLTFRCFSSELAQVLDGFVKSPHGFVIKTVEVEAVPLDYVPPEPGMPPGTPEIRPPRPIRTWPMPTQPPVVRPPGGGRGTQPGGGRGTQPGGGGRQPGGGRGQRGDLQSAPYFGATPVYLAAGGLAAKGGAGASTNTTGLVTILNEKPFRVYMYIESVTLK
jgi:hypothetical protein